MTIPQLTLTLSGPAPATCALSFPLSSGRQWQCPPSLSFGAHLYTRTFGDIALCGLRLSNGAVNKDGTGFMGKFYFDSLALSLPAGYVFVPEALRHGELNTGQRWTIADDGGHVFLPRWILERRFAVCPVGQEQEAIRILRGGDLHIPDPVLNYGPAGSRQPTVDRAAYQTRFTGFVASAKQALAQGSTFYIEDRWDTRGAFGPWQPEGQPDAGPGDPGGDKINPSHGFEQCNAAVEFDKLSLGCIMDRTPVAAFDRTTGEPISLYDWTSPPDRQVMTNGVTELPCFLQGSFGNYTYKQLNTGTCAYEAGLAKYQARDNAHLIRYMQQAIPVIEYTQDKMALDDFAMVMENARYGTWSDRPDQKTTQNYPGEYMPPSLTLALKSAQAHQHDGGSVDRAFGWTMDGGAFLLKHGVPVWLDWGLKMLDLRTLLADKFGCAMNDTSHPEFFAPGFSGIQKFHEDIISIGAFALAHQLAMSIPESINYANQVYVRGQTFPLGGTPYVRGAMHWMATHENGQPTALLVSDNTSGDGGDPAHALACLAFAFRQSGDKKFIDASLKQWIPHPDWTTRMAWLQSQDDLGWIAEMLSVMQQYVAAHGVPTP